MEGRENAPLIVDQEFCEVENLDPAQHQKWLDKHGLKPGEDGTFPVAGFEGRDAVPVEALFDHIRANVAAGYYTPLYTAPYDERTFVMVCGGPSLADHLEEIKLKSLKPDEYLVVCSNMTGGYLLEHGITAHAHFILDPQKHKHLDVASGKTSPQTQYWINVACDPAVFHTLKEQGIKPHAFLADFESESRAIKAVKESMLPGQEGMMAIQGGTMAGLRAINLADALGFRKLQYYGFDATVKVANGRAQPYAYEKKRGEAIIEITCDLCPQKFDTTLIFQQQVNEFLDWQHKTPWLAIEIIGGGLISHSFEHFKGRQREHEKKYVGYRFTNEYRLLQKELHARGHYGTSGQQFLPTIFHAINQLAKRHGSCDVLDYGSAAGDTMKIVREHFWFPPFVTDHHYDPFVDKFAGEPEPADFVICTDVMEHVEPECTMAVLDHLRSLTRRMIFFSIALTPANKNLADGRNAHINLRGQEFWLREINKRFVTSEAKVNASGETVLIVAQSIEDVIQILRSQRNATAKEQRAA